LSRDVRQAIAGCASLTSAFGLLRHHLLIGRLQPFYAMISADLIGCSTARNKGTCENRRSIQRDRLEGRVLNALRYHLMDPALFKEILRRVHVRNEPSSDGRFGLP
jgi:hypothetical protein